MPTNLATMSTADLHARLGDLDLRQSQARDWGLDPARHPIVAGLGRHQQAVRQELERRQRSQDVITATPDGPVDP